MSGKSIPERLFIDYLNGELGEDDIRYIDSHFSPEEQKEIIDQILAKYWSGQTTDHKPERYREMLDKIHKKMGAVHPVKKHVHIDYWYFSKMAASFLIFVSVILFFAITYQPISSEPPPPVNMVHKSTAFGQKLTVVLPDGSSVVLNSGSAISYPEKFPDHIRQIELEGEAFFEVRKKSGKPFHVKSPQMEVTVSGTSFNFNTVNATVSLTEGRIKVSTGDSQVMLSPGEMAGLSSRTGSLEVSNFNFTRQVGWKDGVIDIEDYTVEEVISILEKWYDVDINTRNIDPKKKFAGNFSHRSLANILEGISFALDCKFKINGKNVEIYR